MELDSGPAVSSGPCLQNTVATTHLTINAALKLTIKQA
jgi:hypothetical protein